MIDTAEKRKVHHGRNVKAARTWKDVTQEQLGDKLGLQQCEVSTLEKKEVIEKETLNKIAKILDVDIKFLETFIPEDVLKTYNIDNTSFNNSIADDATETIVMGNFEKQEIDNSLPFSEVKILIDEHNERERQFYNQLREKDEEIFNLKLAQIQRENELLKEELSKKK